MTILFTLAALTAVSGAIATALTLPLPVADPGTRVGPLRVHPPAFGPLAVQASRPPAATQR